MFVNSSKVFFCYWLTDEENHTYVVAETTTQFFVDFKIFYTTLYRGTEKEIGRSEVVGFAAYESTCTAVAGGAGSSVDFARTTETARGSESVNFVDDADTTACDGRERIANWSAAGRLDYL